MNEVIRIRTATTAKQRRAIYKFLLRGRKKVRELIHGLDREQAADLIDLLIDTSKWSHNTIWRDE